jgi:hypothetical protein
LPRATSLELLILFGEVKSTKEVNAVQALIRKSEVFRMSDLWSGGGGDGPGDETGEYGTFSDRGTIEGGQVEGEGFVQRDETGRAFTKRWKQQDTQQQDLAKLFDDAEKERDGTWRKTWKDRDGEDTTGNEDAATENEDADPGNEDADLGNEDAATGNEDADPGNEDEDPGNEDADPGNEDEDPGNEDEYPRNEDEDPGNEDEDPGNEDDANGVTPPSCPPLPSLSIPDPIPSTSSSGTGFGTIRLRPIEEIITIGDTSSEDGDEDGDEDRTVGNR